MTICERCGASPPMITSGPFAGSAGMHDYCEHCSRNLCSDCMRDGKCADSHTGLHEAAGEDTDE